MKKKTLFITPPFTQLNTPYPATAYLKGFLNTKGYPAAQADLGMEVILELFSSGGLRSMFRSLENTGPEHSENSERTLALQADYIDTIDPVILFLQNKTLNTSLLHVILNKMLKEGQLLLFYLL